MEGFSQAPAGTVLALDNVPLQLPLARAATRALAAFVDYLIVGVLVLIWSVACAAAAFSLRDSFGLWFLPVYLLGLFAMEYGYFAAWELSTRGRTLGKMLIGLQVVAADGAQPALSALLVRNLVRSIDIFVGVPLMVLDPLSRRLGDRLGGTVVVAMPREADEVMLERMPSGWGGREIALLEALLMRAEELRPARRSELSERMLNWIDRVDPGFINDEVRSRDALTTLRRATGFARA
jgi:uncharacterized RDD family membrane protein YckC